ncbi:MAG: AMP-binding protein [Mesorhizobium sp.]
MSVSREMERGLQTSAAAGQRHVRLPIPGVVYPPQAALDQYLRDDCLTLETLAEGFRAAARAFPANIALKGPGLNMTYAELDALSSRLGAALINLGLKPLDRVVFQLNDSAELVIGWLACLKASLVPICTLAAHREHEIGYLAELAQAKVHFIQGDNPKFDDVSFARKMRDTVPSLSIILKARGKAEDGTELLSALIDSISQDDAERVLGAIDIDPFQVAVFQLSGGTTGIPKIIPRFNNEYLYNMRASAEWFAYGPDDVLFMPQPMVHNLNMSCCFGPMLLSGGTVTIAPDLRAETLIDLIKTTSPTWLMLGGPIVARIDTAIRSGEIDLSNAKGVLSPNSAEKLRAMLGVPVYHAFGITEGCIMFTRPGDPAETLNTTHGRPVSVWDEVKILRPGTEEEVPLGEVGTPAFKGPYTIHGYFNAPERNLETFTSDGYYLSGDLIKAVEIDGVRNFVYSGRLKDIVSRAGEKINCQEVEMAVIDHPSVAAVVAVPYPDPVYEERLCVYLILRGGQKAPTVRELGAFLEAFGMAKYKWPERIETVSEFPLTASGKLSRPELKAMIARKVAAESPQAAAAQ